ncbi:MAG: SpoIIE family protein phosphatase [Oscillospiraceae bacterium]|jgi:stage II sporulation protein E|nr:SpoIIE family protein phosphatase [Oscillospiraceae bacterium]
MAQSKAQRPQALQQIALDGKKLRRAALFVLEQSAGCLLGMALAQSQFAGGLFRAGAPFAVALAAAGAVKTLGMQVFGTAVGSLLFLPFPQNIAVMAATAAAGLGNLASARLRLRRSLAAPFLAGICAAAAGLVSLFSAGGAAAELPFLLAASALSGGSAYFISTLRGIHCFSLCEQENKRRQLRLSSRERTAVLLCLSMLLAALGGIRLGPFVPARTLGVLAVLAAAVCWRESGGALAGACVGAAMTFAGGDPSYAAVYALGGLLAGLFADHGLLARPAEKPWRSITAALGYSLVCAMFAVFQAAAREDAAPAAIFVLESLLAVVCFLAVPARSWDRLQEYVGGLLEPGKPAPKEASLRLVQTAQALRKVSGYVEEVAAGLARLHAPLEQSVLAWAQQSVCEGCAEYAVCWKTQREESAAFFAQALELLRADTGLSAEQVERLRRKSGLAAPCRSAQALGECLGRAYCGYAVRADCHQKEAQLRQAAAEQFEALAQLLDDLREQLHEEDSFVPEAAQAAARALEALGLRVRAVSCLRNPAGALVLTAAARLPEDIPPREAMARAVSRAVGAAFDPPVLEPSENDGCESVLTFPQRTGFRITLGAVQMSSSASDYCGDYFDCFGDGQGRELLVLSDGMGTGGRAAVDAALAAEIFSSLVRGGLQFPCAMRMANAALLVKSCEESLATLDAARINLYNGSVEFCKAGAALSFLRRGGKAAKVELPALPAGILSEIRPAQETASLREGDIVVLVSDGTVSDAGGWFCEALETWPEGAGDMQALAEHLAGLAVTRRRESREDDLTVICAQLHRK